MIHADGHKATSKNIAHDPRIPHIGTAAYSGYMGSVELYYGATL